MSDNKVVSAEQMVAIQQEYIEEQEKMIATLTQMNQELLGRLQIAMRYLGENELH